MILDTITHTALGDHMQRQIVAKMRSTMDDLFAKTVMTSSTLKATPSLTLDTLQKTMKELAIHDTGNVSLEINEYMEPLPKMSLTSKVPVTAEFRAETNAWMREFFGTYEPVFLFTDHNGRKSVIASRGAINQIQGQL